MEAFSIVESPIYLNSVLPYLLFFPMLLYLPSIILFELSKNNCQPIYKTAAPRTFASPFHDKRNALHVDVRAVPCIIFAGNEHGVV